MLKKIIILLCVSLGLGLLAKNCALTFQQALSIAIFSASIGGTLLFWEFRLGFAFLGTSILLISRTIDLDHLVKFASLDVILFLVGMMILVGSLKEAGFFNIIAQGISQTRKVTAVKFVVVISLISALLSAVVSEVVSIIFMVAAIFKCCDHFEVDCTPYVMISVFATNIGSAATVLGNPIGILIATKAGLTFEDFIIKALPLSVLCLVAAILLIIVFYKKALKQLDENIKKIATKKIETSPSSVQPGKDFKISAIIFVVTLFFISIHHRLEILWGLPPNTILLIMPLISSGIIMLLERQKARDYVEKDVEWWTLLFFMLLFAQAGTLKYTGVTDTLAGYLAAAAGNSTTFLTAIILWLSAVGSSILDNVVLVAAFIPVIQGLKATGATLQPLWWALLFGGCMGGNITLVGSTANIVALGMLEKQKNIHMTFLRWFWAGLAVGVCTTAIVWLVLTIVPWYH